ncbi:MAG: glutaredoxin family protein [Anaerolineae bacterium]|nr:glutaredoxin family protein [Anaerolineae bacterium]
MDKELVMYTRTDGCPYITVAKRIFEREGIPYREIYIDHDPEAERRVREWTGFLSVPTLVIANPGEDLPYELVPPLPEGESPRGIDRGAMLTEGNAGQLKRWLRRHGFLK